MKNRLVVSTTVGLVTLAIALLPAICHSQEKTLRQKLKERRLARQSQTAENAVSWITQAGDYTFTLQQNGLSRRYRVHVPAGYTPDKPIAMLLSLHGGGGNMDYQADDRYYGLISKSDSAGFVAVFPNGYSRLRSGKMATWNAGICCGAARDKGIDDVGFLRAVVRDMQSRMNIDPRRIFASGMSNGGMMSYRLACEMADTFKAIASVAGTDGTLACAPSRAVSILHIHASDDDRVLYNGGSGSASASHADFVSVPDTIAKWVSLNACNAGPTRVLQVTGAYCEQYSPCREQTQVKLCVTETGGHSWPGGRKIRGGTLGSTAISATDLMWDFFNSQ